MLGGILTDSPTLGQARDLLRPGAFYLAAYRQVYEALRALADQGKPPGFLVIGREVETDFGGYIDLLCIDAVGDLVVIELKREGPPSRNYRSGARLWFMGR